MYNGYNDFEECDFCVDKATTNGCLTCEIGKIKSAIRGFNEYINTRIDYKKDLICINEKYKQYIKKYSDLNLVPKKMIRYLTDVMDDDVVVMVLNAKALCDINIQGEVN